MSTIKINFVINRTNEEVDHLLKINPDNSPELFLNYYMVWCLQTYLRLSKRSNLQLICSNQMQSDCINIITSELLTPLKSNSSTFIVCARIDHPKRFWAHYHIVQNKKQVDINSSYIPHWPQPGQIARNPSRNNVKTIGYVGYAHNGNLASTPETWKKMLEPHGLEFVFLPEKAWHDLSSIDVLLGIRSYDKNSHNNKPPSKLINAWHAKIPFIGGYDSAFTQIGMPGDDYLLVETQQEALAAILRLRDEPELYLKIVNNGLKKSTEYTIDNVSNIWEEVLTGPVIERYVKWKFNKRLEINRFFVLSKIGRLQHLVHQFIKKL